MSHIFDSSFFSQSVNYRWGSEGTRSAFTASNKTAQGYSWENRSRRRASKWRLIYVVDLQHTTNVFGGVLFSPSEHHEAVSEKQDWIYMADHLQSRAHAIEDRKWIVTGLVTVKDQSTTRCHCWTPCFCMFYANYCPDWEMRAASRRKLTTAELCYPSRMCIKCLLYILCI